MGLAEINEAIELVKAKDYIKLASRQDIWDNGIHDSLDPCMPFDISFDDFICPRYSKPLDAKKNKLLASDKFQEDMLAWLDRCKLLFKARNDTNKGILFCFTNGKEH